MVNDLFLDKQTLLENWMKGRGFFSTHEVLAKGLELYYTRADRTKRDFLKQGLIRKLPDSEKSFRGFKCKDAVYEYVK